MKMPSGDDVPVGHDDGTGDESGLAMGEEGADEPECLVARIGGVAAGLACRKHEAVGSYASLVEFVD